MVDAEEDMIGESLFIHLISRKEEMVLRGVRALTEEKV